MITKSVHINGVFNLSNYKLIFQKYNQNIINSLYVGIMTAILCAFLSVAITIFISIQNSVIRTISTLIILIALVSPPFVSSLSYIILYGRRGMITYDLLKLSVNPYNEYGIILMQSFSFIPLNVIYLLSIMDRIDRSIINSAIDVGASGKRVLRDIILPMLKSGILVILILTFVRSICDFATPTIVGGRYSTFSSEIYLQIIGFSDLEKTAAMNVILMIPSIIMFFIYLYNIKKIDSKLISRTINNERIKLKKLGIDRVIIYTVAIGYLLIVFLQYFVIFFYSIFKKSYGKYVFTTEYINKFFNYDFTSLIRSIIYAIIVSLICQMMAVLLTYIRRNNKSFKIDLLNLIIMIPFMIPGTYFGISYILAFNKAPLKLTNTAIIVILNIVYKQLPITTKMFEGAFLQIPKELDNSCLDLGGSNYNIILDCIIPKIKSTFTSVFIYNFNSAMTTAGSILFLISPGRKLAIFDLFDSIYIGEYHEACILSAMIIIIVVLMSAITKLLEKGR